MVRVNGEDVEALGMSISSYLNKNGYDQSRLAVEKNGEIVPKRMYQEIFLQEGDVVEIVSFVGGG